jgi:Flp pilus assembly protein TadD/outer membrane protein OmpA-like peptidoglycan-associated protein
MKKRYKFLIGCLLAAMIGILPILSYSQEEPAATKMTHKDKRLQYWDSYWFINLHAAADQSNTDVVVNKYISPISNWRYGGGGHFGWQFHPIWGVRAGIDFGNLYGQSKKDVFWMQTLDPVYANGLFFRAKFMEYKLDATINFSNLISGYNPDRFLDIYGIVGFGITEWTTSGYYFDDAGNAVLRYEDGKDVRGDDGLATPNYKGYHDGLKQGWNRKSDINAGIGAAFHIIPQLEANFEIQYKTLTGGKDTYEGHNPDFRQGDFLDNLENGEQAVYNDMYSTVSLGLTYKFVEGDPLKKMKKEFETVTFKAEPNPLEAHGGKVPVKVTGTIPADYFNPKAAMFIQPYYVCEGEKIEMKPVLLKGTKVGGEGIVISEDGGSFTYETTIDYKDNCRAADLIIEPVLFVPKEDIPAGMTKEDALGYKKNVELPAKKLADGTIVTPQRFAFNQTGAIVPHGYVKENILSKNATIFFEVNKHNLNMNVPQNKIEANKAKLSEVFEFVNLGYKIKDINIDGWASPEGEETFNQGLSENRTKTANKYIVDKIKGMIKAKDSKLTIKDAEKDVVYNLAHHGPDWNGFITALQNSDMKDKNSMLNVINSAGTPAMKEQKIREMIAIYPDIDPKLLQPLRRADIVVNCYEPKKTDEEIASLATSNPSALDEKELLYAASMQQDKKAKLEIYKTAIKQFPDSYKGYANAGGIEIELNDITAAKAHLEKAASLNPNSGEVYNNLGIISALEGDYLKAEEQFVKAGQLGTDASYNLGVISIIKGEYSKALSQFGSKTCDYNVALAYIASKNYPPAEKQLTCAPKDAQTHYLLAVLGSRTANTTMLFENLGKAIQMNAAYKEEAKIDREFIKYFEDPNFTSLVK